MDEAKKTALELAIKAGENKATEDIITTAEKFYTFLSGSVLAKSEPFNNPSSTPKVKKFLSHVTPECRVILKKAIEIYHKGSKVNGVSIAKELKMSNACCSMHLRKLVKNGYIFREGNKFIPMFASDGTEVSKIIQQYPAAYAKGYKPLTQKLGDVAPLSMRG